MIAPRAMLTRGSVVAEVEETPLACIRVLDRECVCVCARNLGEGRSCVPLVYPRTTARIPTSGIVEGGNWYSAD